MHKYEKIKLKIPSSKLKQIANFYRNSDTSIEDIIADVVESCADLCERHAEEMEAYNFESKANTAHTCAGIVKEAYGLEHEVIERLEQHD